MVKIDGVLDVCSPTLTFPQFTCPARTIFLCRHHHPLDHVAECTHAGGDGGGSGSS